jgi:hypothetical protein
MRAGISSDKSSSRSSPVTADAPPLYFVPLAGLDPATHVLIAGRGQEKTWMPGTSPGKAMVWFGEP